MADRVSTTISVSLGKDSASSSSASAEIDTRSLEDGGLNASQLGKTQDFEPGDTINALLFLPDDIVFDSSEYPHECFVEHSLDGIGGAQFSVLSEGNKSNVVVEQDLAFDGANTRTITLSKPTTPGVLDGEWLGLDLAAFFGGSVTVDEDGLTARLPDIPESMRSPYQPADNDTADTLKTKALQLAKKTSKIGIYRARYISQARVCRFVTPSRQTMVQQLGKPPYSVNIVIYCKRVSDEA